MIGNLYYKNGRGQITLVVENTNNDSKELMQALRAHIRKLNSTYHIPYIRVWGSEEKGWTYDVGSWSEFFKFVPEGVELDWKE